MSSEPKPLQNQPTLPLLKIDKLEPEAIEKFTVLLREIRQLRWFIAQVLPGKIEEDASWQNYYSTITAAVINSILRLMNLPSSEPYTDELIAKLQGDLNIAFQESSLYGIDKGSLLAVAETALRDTDTFLAANLKLNLHSEQEILAAMPQTDVLHLGLLSKGLIIAYAWLAARLNYLVDQNKLDRQQAVDYLNRNLSLISIDADSEQLLTGPDSTEFHVHLDPQVVEQIRNNIQEGKQFTLVYDELIGEGHSFKALMRFLIDECGPQVVELVRFIIPGSQVDYVPLGHRRNYLNPALATTPDGKDLLINAQRVDQTQYQYVWEIRNISGNMYKSIVLNID